MLAFANVMYLFPDKFSGLGARGLSLMLVPARARNSFFFWHMLLNAALAGFLTSWAVYGSGWRDRVIDGLGFAATVELRFSRKPVFQIASWHTSALLEEDVRPAGDFVMSRFTMLVFSYCFSHKLWFGWPRNVG